MTKDELLKLALPILQGLITRDATTTITPADIGYAVDLAKELDAAAGEALLKKSAAPEKPIQCPEFQISDYINFNGSLWRVVKKPNSGLQVQFSNDFGTSWIAMLG